MQSLIVAAVLSIAAVQLAGLAVVGDLLAASRMLQQRTLERVRRVELALGVPPSHYEPGASPEAAPATTGAEAGPEAGAATSSGEREALRL